MIPEDQKNISTQCQVYFHARITYRLELMKNGNRRYNNISGGWFTHEQSQAISREPVLFMWQSKPCFHRGFKYLGCHGYAIWISNTKTEIWKNVCHFLSVKNNNDADDLIMYSRNTLFDLDCISTNTSCVARLNNLHIWMNKKYQKLTIQMLWVIFIFPVNTKKNMFSVKSTYKEIPVVMNWFSFLNLKQGTSHYTFISNSGKKENI